MDKIKLQQVCDRYLGLRAITGAHDRNSAVDCSTLPALIMEDMGFGPYTDLIEYGYTGDWYMSKNGGDLLKPYMEKFCRQIKKGELREGDIIMYKYGYAASHLAVVYDMDNKWVIHTHAERGVELTEMDNPILCKKNGKTRAVSYWRVKEDN